MPKLIVCPKMNTTINSIVLTTIFSGSVPIRFTTLPIIPVTSPSANNLDYESTSLKYPEIVL